MLKGEGFGPHDKRGGDRLGRQQGLGPTALGRRFVTVSEEGAGEGSVGCAPPAGRPLPAPRPGKKMGRPRFEGVRPWEAEGISRAAYFRRKKEAGG